MTAGGLQAAALALHRFGFGPLPGSLAAIAGDPRGALLAELDSADTGPAVGADLPSSAEAARTLFEFRAARRAQVKLESRPQPAADSDADAAAMATTLKEILPEPSRGPQQQPLPQRLFLHEAQARIGAAAGARIGFVERLVWFWSNHFCVSASKIPAMAGPYEREAIRPHALGRFADLLQAVESHPAMLFYLDNVQSMGPYSVAGINRDKGLNENLARETLELHTLGVRAGYTQNDVTSFAKVLTGWSWIPPGEPVHGGEFAFYERMHEPGVQVVLGKHYGEAGIRQGRAVLTDLARHPATARHVAQKLASHFVADDPPPSLAAKIERTFVDTDGDLRQVAKTLLTADESWSPQRTKLKPPDQWLAAVLRATGKPSAIPVGRVLGAQAMLGEPLWRPPAPNGYADTEAAWIDGVPHRLDIADEFAGRLATGFDPLTVLDDSLGPLASPESRRAVARAETRKQALALLFMTPEFLRS